MQITEQLIERIARRVFNAMFAPALRQSNVQGGGTSGSVRYAEEAGHAASADTADSANTAAGVPWTGVSGKPSNMFAYLGQVSNGYVEGTAYSTLNSGTYIHQLTGATDSLIHFQADGSASGLDIRFSYTQDASNPLKYRKTTDSHHFSGGWVTIIDSNNIGSQSVSYASTSGSADSARSAEQAGHAATAGTATNAGYATSAGNADTVDGYHESAFLHLSGGTMSGNINIGNTTIYASGTNGGINSLAVADDCILGDCNIGGHLGLKSLNTNNAGISFYNLNGSQIGQLSAYNGNIGIGTNSPSYKLHVAGNIYCTGGFTFLSDIRKKDVETYKWSPTLDMIADAPIIRYTMKDDETHRMRVGSVAQYWQKVMPETVTETDDVLSMDGTTIALTSVIALAREVKQQKVKIDRLIQQIYG